MKTAQSGVIKVLRAMKMKRKQTIRKKKKGNYLECSTKETKQNFLWEITAADFATEENRR
jgi:hypothetical protein